MKKFGLIGKTLKHSFSKDFFNYKFENEKIEASYHNFEIDKIERLLVKDFTKEELKEYEKSVS